MHVMEGKPTRTDTKTSWEMRTSETIEGTQRGHRTRVEMSRLFINLLSSMRRKTTTAAIRAKEEVHRQDQIHYANTTEVEGDTSEETTHERYRRPIQSDDDDDEHDFYDNDNGF